MRLTLVWVAALSLLSLGAAIARTATDFGAPRERPAASFTGAHHVDSQGCVFRRGGFNGSES